jgi:hypothetical protein
MTNLLNLPQIPAGTTITISADGDWDDQFYVPQPGFPAAPLTIAGTLSSSSTTVSALSATSGVAPGMLAMGYGIPAGTTVVSVNPGASSLVLSNEPTVNFPGAEIVLYPPPLDLTGITFTSMLRLATPNPTVLFEASTSNGLMTNNNTGGSFGWSVPQEQLPNWPPGLAAQGSLSCVIDIQATDATGATVNLCEGGSIPVTVTLASTR